MGISFSYKDHEALSDVAQLYKQWQSAPEEKHIQELCLTQQLSSRNPGSYLQQNLRGHGWVWPAVLWAWLQLPKGDTQGEVSLQVPLVLLRGVQDLRAGGGHSHL